jgi:ABC-type transport system involved in multi-copper enzyme maturation permease subunit
MMLNPVFRKDMRVLFRNAKVYIGLTVYLFVLVQLTGLILRMIEVNTYNGFNPEYVMGAYLGMLGSQMLAITFIVPAFTSSSISGERERQTLDFMLITRMTGWDIVFGKLMSSLLLVCLMIVASMPIYAVIFYYGGISVFGFLVNILFLMIYATFVGSVAVLFSTVLKRTVAATAVSNLFILGLSIGTGILVTIIAGIVSINGLNDLGEFILGIVCIAILSLNPIVSFISIVDSQMGTTTIWDGVSSMLNIDFEPGFLQVWHIVAVAYLVVSFVILKAAAKNILPNKKYRPKTKKKKVQIERELTVVNGELKLDDEQQSDDKTES